MFPFDIKKELIIPASRFYFNKNIFLESFSCVLESLNSTSISVDEDSIKFDGCNFTLDPANPLMQITYGYIHVCEEKSNIFITVYLNFRKYIFAISLFVFLFVLFPLIDVINITLIKKLIMISGIWVLLIFTGVWYSVFLFKGLIKNVIYRKR